MSGDLGMREEGVGRLTEMGERELAEVRHALYYAGECHHGTTGHNQLMLIAKMADALGFRLGEDRTSLWLRPAAQVQLAVPDGVVRLLGEEGSA